MLFSSAGVHPFLGSALSGKPSSSCNDLHVHGNPLCKLGGQPLEGRVVLAVRILKPDLKWLLLGHVLDRGRGMFVPDSCSCEHPSWLQKVQIKPHRPAQVVTGALHKCQ